MKDSFKKINCILTVILLICTTLTTVYYYKQSQNNKKVNNNNIETKKTIYNNSNLGFSLVHSDWIFSNEFSNNVVFYTRITSTGEKLDLFTVSVENTNFDTTNDWLYAQQLGNMNIPGYEPIFWVGLDLGGAGKLFASEYYYNDKREIVKRLVVVQVTNRTLYKINTKGYFSNSTPGVDYNEYDYFGSFKTFGTPKNIIDINK